MEAETQERDDVSPILEAHVRRFAGLLSHARARHGLAPGDLEELVQEVRLRLWRAQRTGEKISGVSASYMYRTAMTAAVDLIRRRRHESRETSLPETAGAQGLPEFARSPSDPAEAEELRRRMGQALAALPKARAVAVRLHLSGYPREEIGTLMGWSEAKARNLIYRGLADLRAQLSGMGVGPGGTT
jgi:RNA polymerase sigma-70 factor (ECF subfamily)